MAQYFGLSLDTTAPNLPSFSGLSAYYNGAATVTITASTAEGAETPSFMQVWIDQTATTSTAPTGVAWEAFATSKQLTASAEGTNYFHAIFMDAVGNTTTAIHSDSFIYDTTGPVISAVENASRVKLKSVDVKVTAADAKTGIDAVSGVASVTITGTDSHIAAQTFTWDDTDRTNGYKTCAVTLTISAEEEAAKTPVTCSFSVDAADRAGNAATQVTGKSVIYDAFPASATMTLMDEDCSAALPSYVNAYDYGVQITSSDTDIASYKVWEGSTEPTEWETWTGSPLNITDQTFSTGEGLKTIHGKIKDTTGNETTLTDVSTTVDTTAPVVTLTSDVTVISAQSGFDTVTFTYEATDAHSMTNYELYVDSVKIKNGTFTTEMTEAVTNAEIKAKSAGTGAKSFVLKVTDIAGNVGESSALTITIDELAPTDVSVTAAEYYKAGDAVTVTIAATEQGGSTLSKMKCWTGTTEPSDWEDYAASKTFTGLADGTYTVSLKVKDAVDNVAAVVTDEFVIDTVAPTATPTLDNVTISGTVAYTDTKSHTVTLNATDATSGVTLMKVWGDIVDGATEPEWETYAATKSITLTDGDGTKALHFKLKDAAGNETAQFEYGYTLQLDETDPGAAITLRKADDSANLPSKVNVRNFAVHIEGSDATESTVGLTYQLTGDFDQSSEEWKTYTEESGQTYMLISGLTLTTGDALKTITVTFKDKAGNTKSASATVTLDTAAPVIDVTSPNYSVLSKTHDDRRSADGTPKTKPEGREGKEEYTDYIKFSWSCSEFIAEYKVCVNEKDQTAEGATAIGTTNGSVNMTGTNVAANTTTTCYINGKDFAATEKVGDIDGAYEVIVYGKDEAGTWSAIHAIEA